MPKVLAVDDDPVMTEYYSALFAEAGYDVEIAVDCGSALDKCRVMNPDLLVLDFDIPGGDGGRLLSIIRGVHRLGKPVIFVTGFPEKARGLARTYVAVSVLGKPVKGDALLEEARRMTAGGGYAVET